MSYYLSIILRNQFTLFYRFGYTYIPKVQLIDFSGDITDDVKLKIANLFHQFTPFEWDDEYLIIQFEKASVDEEIVKFHIQDVVKVFPLSKQAKASIETKMDTRIRLEEAEFEDILAQVEANIEKHELEKAIQALWSVCGIEADLEKFLINIGLDNCFKGMERRKAATKSSQILEGNYWEYVLAYDRTDYFPNSTLGCFYDAGQIFAYSKGDPTFEGSGYHKLLEFINVTTPNILFSNIVKKLENDERSKGFITKNISNDIIQYKVTPLFIKLREEIRKADNIGETPLVKNLKSLKQTYGDSFNYAVILLGAFFGFKKFYDLYYDGLNLRFYKSYNSISEKKKLEEKGGIDKEEIELKNKPDELPTEVQVKIGIKTTDNKKQKKNREITNSEEQEKNEQSSNNESEILLSAPENRVETKNTDTANSTNQFDKSNQINLFNNSSLEESSNLDKYIKLIDEILMKTSEIELKQIAALLNDQPGEKKKKFTNTFIREIIKGMDSVDYFKIKNVEMAKRKI